MQAYFKNISLLTSPSIIAETEDQNLLPFLVLVTDAKDRDFRFKIVCNYNSR